MKNKVILAVLLTSILFFMNLSYVSGVDLSVGKSNESIGVRDLVLSAEKCIEEMQSRGINITRANESFQQSIYLYTAGLNLEKKSGSADYKLANQSAKEVCQLRDISFQAQDELTLFIQKWELDSEKFNLSTISKEYNKIVNSFNDERFEETIELITEGYKTLADFESTQTSLGLFYETTTKTIKDFFVNNWKELSISAIVITIFLIIFWKTLKRITIKKKLENLSLRKYSINKLIKRIQGEYFNKKTMSETEYFVKIKTFGEMMREIDKKIPELHEELAKINNKKEKIRKNKIKRKVPKIEEVPKKKKINVKMNKPKRKVQKKKKQNKKIRFKKKRRQ